MPTQSSKMVSANGSSPTNLARRYPFAYASMHVLDYIPCSLREPDPFHLQSGDKALVDIVQTDWGDNGELEASLGRTIEWCQPKHPP